MARARGAFLGVIVLLCGSITTIKPTKPSQPNLNRTRNIAANGNVLEGIRINVYSLLSFLLFRYYHSIIHKTRSLEAGREDAIFSTNGTCELLLLREVLESICERLPETAASPLNSLRFHQWRGNIVIGEMVLVYFYLSYSGRSEQFYTDVADLARKHPNVNFFKVDVELLKSIAKAYDVNGTACVLLMPNENKELVVRGKFSKMDKEELEKFLKSHL